MADIVLRCNKVVIELTPSVRVASLTAIDFGPLAPGSVAGVIISPDLIDCPPMNVPSRAKPRNRTCIDCACQIKRGLRCGPCRDLADERRRQAAYVAKKASQASKAKEALRGY